MKRKCMIIMCCMLIFITGVTALCCENAVSKGAAEELLEESEWESVKKFTEFKKGDLFADLAAEIDLPYEDIGFGIYIYFFTISESSKVYVYSYDGKTISGISLKFGENAYVVCD